MVVTDISRGNCDDCVHREICRIRDELLSFRNAFEKISMDKFPNNKHFSVAISCREHLTHIEPHFGIRNAK